MTPKWLRSLKDSGRDLERTDQRAEVLIKKCGTGGKSTFKDKGDEGRWFLVDASSAMSEVLLPTPTAIDKAKLVDHTK